MQDCVKEVRDLESSYEDINALIELTEEEEDREMIKEIQREIAKFEKEFEDLRIRTLLSGEYDSCNAIVTLHAEPEEQTAVTGQICCIVCIQDMHSQKDFR